LDGESKLAFPVIGTTDQLSRLGVERDLQLLFSEVLSSIVALSADGELSLVLAENSIRPAGRLSRARERGSPVVFDEECGRWIDADGPFSAI
jgi:hypothetical protein